MSHIFSIAQKRSNMYTSETKRQLNNNKIITWENASWKPNMVRVFCILLQFDCRRFYSQGQWSNSDKHA